MTTMDYGKTDLGGVGAPKLHGFPSVGRTFGNLTAPDLPELSQSDMPNLDVSDINWRGLVVAIKSTRAGNSLGGLPVGEGSGPQAILPEV
jgi:hypothetical protein